MKNVFERIRKSGPYKHEMKAYDKRNFPGQKAWPIDPEAAYESKPIPTNGLEDTIPMPAGSEEMDAVHNARTLEDALYEFDKRYPLEEIDAGKRSPQLGAEMLLSMAKKFDDSMTPEQKSGVALETIKMGEEIIRLADKPAEKSKEWTSVKGLMELAEIITLAEEYAPEKVETLKKGLEHVADRVESRAPAISGPIKIALEESEKSPYRRFETIHEEIEHEHLNNSNVQFMLKEQEIKRQKKEREERIRAARNAGAVALAQILEKRAKEMDTSASTQAELMSTQAGTAVASLEDLESDDDSKVLVGTGKR